MHGALRAVRGTFVALAILATSALAHVVAGGLVMLETPRILAFLAVAIVFAIRLSRSEWTIPRLLVALGVAQIAIHIGLQVRILPLAPGLPESRQSLLDSAVSGMPAMPMGAHGPHESASLANPVTMLISHAVAVVLLCALLRFGESWALALRDLLAQVVPTLSFAKPLPTIGRPVRVQLVSPRASLQQQALSKVRPLRAPPFAVAPTF